MSAIIMEAHNGVQCGVRENQLSLCTVFGTAVQALRKVASYGHCACGHLGVLFFVHLRERMKLCACEDYFSKMPLSGGREKVGFRRQGGVHASFG